MKKSIILIFVSLLTFLLFGCDTDPEKPIINGVEEGNIYGKSVNIILDKIEKDVVYSATINNQDYELGNLFSIEGTHILTITATRNNKSVTMSVNFEIDTTPPLPPIVTGVNDEGIYLESVSINVEKEDGIVNTATIDGHSYTFNSPFNEEGKHTLKVISIKERNNHKSEINIDFTIDNTFYTQKEVDYFTEIALGSEYGGSPYVKKWLSNIKIKVGGNPTADDLKTLNKVVSELNAIIPTIELSIVDDNETINMYFVPQGDFRKYIPSAVLGNWAYFSYYTKDKWEIEKAIITIGTFGSDQRDRNHHIIEELTQALGMGNDSPKYKNSIFHEDEGESLNQAYSELDRKVIEILYRQDITLGMNKEDILKVLDKRIQ